MSAHAPAFAPPPAGGRRGGVRVRALRRSAWALVLWGLAAPLAAQSVEQAQEQRELEYQAALSAHESAQAAYRALQSRFEQWSDSLNVARIAQDETRANAAYSQLMPLSTDLASADRRVGQTAQALERARFALKDLVDKRMDLLVEQIEFANSDEDRRRLALQYQDLSNRFDELELASLPALQVSQVLLPNIVAQPTDGARELSAKAELLERYAARYDTLISTIQNELADAEKRGQRDRTMNGFLAGLDRYGDTNLPVGPAREVARGDGERATTLAEQVDELRALVGRYETLREEARERALNLRRRAQEITE